MKFLTIILLFLAISIEAYTQDHFTFEHNGLTREYILYKPENLSANSPLVFVLHGYTSSNLIIMSYSGMNDIADENNFAVCYPQGTRDNFNTTHWNAQLAISETDDIDFITELALYLQNEHNFNPQGTFICGMSNGGFMSYTLACERPEVFKAIASVTGTMSGYTWENRSIAQAIPILQMHGIDDVVVPIDGSITTLGGWGGAPHVDEVVQYWANLNECNQIDSSKLSDITKVYEYKNGINNNEVWYYKISNWGHVWPTTLSISETGVNASEIIWQFFNKKLQCTSVIFAKGNDNDLFIYPNPTKSIINISGNYTKPTNYQIISTVGEIIYNGDITSNKKTIDLSNIPANIYFLKIGNKVNRIVKIE
jgi:polyhydroxybutyrate depolymerase